MKQSLLFLSLLLCIFAMKAQNTIVDCGVPAITVNYCYVDNDSTVFTYVSSNGSPLILTIITGNVENNIDVLDIIDSDGGTNLYGSFGNSGDISGLEFQSTGDQISFSITSNDSVSCASGANGLSGGIAYTVSCSSCASEIDLGPDQTICQGDFIILDAVSSFANNYSWYRDGYEIEGQTGPTLIVTESGNYNVVFFSEYCDSYVEDSVLLTFVDCSTTGLIEVNAFVDANGNSIFDVDENKFKNGYFTYEMNNDGVINTVTSSTGSFTIGSFEATNSYDFAYYFYDGYQNCFEVAISTFDNVNVENGSEITLDFPVLEEQNCEDIAVYLIGNSGVRPGFAVNNVLIIENLGSNITSGTVEFVIDENLVYNSFYTDNYGYTLTATATGFLLDFVDLEPGSSATIYLFLTCPSTLSLGTGVTNSVTYITAINDVVSENNSSTLSQVVTGSYDPNDIMESHGPKIVYDDFAASDEYLYYLIRFQNIGTAEAINIRIIDVLDSQLDDSTFQMLHSSHENVVTRINNELIWQFDDINLPSESMDEEASNGFVYFKIKPQTGYGIGDIIPNVADIYFDFNAAITTNVFNTEFVETLSVDGFSTTRFSMFPNPANTNVTLQFEKVIDGSIKVLDLQGKMIFTDSFLNSNRLKLDVSAFESGLYFVKLNDGSNEFIKKLIIE